MVMMTRNRKERRLMSGNRLPVPQQAPAEPEQAVVCPKCNEKDSINVVLQSVTTKIACKKCGYTHTSVEEDILG